MQPRLSNLKEAADCLKQNLERLDELKSHLAQLKKGFNELNNPVSEIDKNAGIALSNFVRDLEDIKEIMKLKEAEKKAAEKNLEGINKFLKPYEEKKDPKQNQSTSMFGQIAGSVFEYGSNAAGYVYTAYSKEQKRNLEGIIRTFTESLTKLNNKITLLENLHKQITEFEDEIFEYISYQNSTSARQHEIAFFNLQSVRAYLLATNFNFPRLDRINEKIETALKATSGKARVLLPMPHNRWKTNIGDIKQSPQTPEKKKRMAEISNKPFDRKVEKPTLDVPKVDIQQEVAEFRKTLSHSNKTDEQQKEYDETKLKEALEPMEKELHEKERKQKEINEKLMEEREKLQEKIRVEKLEAREEKRAGEARARKEKAANERKAKIARSVRDSKLHEKKLERHKNALDSLDQILKKIIIDDVHFWNSQLGIGKYVVVKDNDGNDILLPRGVGKIYNIYNNKAEIQGIGLFHSADNIILSRLKLIQNESKVRLEKWTRRSPLTEEFYKILKEVKVQELKDTVKIEAFTKRLQQFSDKIQQEQDKKLRRKK